MSGLKERMQDFEPRVVKPAPESQRKRDRPTKEK